MKKLILLSIVYYLFTFFCVTKAERYLVGRNNNGYDWGTTYLGISNYVWWGNQNPWRINQNAYLSTQLSSNQQVSTLIQSAYNEWISATNNFSISYANETSKTYGTDGQNVHYWVSNTSDEIYAVLGPPGSGRGAAVSFLTVNSVGEIIDADVIYEGYYRRGWNDGGYYDIWGIALHEIGHTIGLQHSEDSNAIMADDDSHPRQLTQDDIAGAKFLIDHIIIESQTLPTQGPTFGPFIYFYWSVTIPSSVTVNFSAGSELHFNQGALLIVNGTLNAVGNSTTPITFNRIGSSGIWGGIQFNNGSSGNLQYCNINYATVGVYFYNSSSPQIRYCTFEYNGTAISCYYYSSPQIISNNNFRYNTVDGIRCNSYSSPGLLSYGYPGYNVIRNNSRYGVYASYNSNPGLGNSPYGGQNSIYSNSSCEVLAEYNCNIVAQYNWWGSSNPSPYEFCTNSSTITYLPALSSDPNPGRMIIDNYEKNISTPISYSIQVDDLSSALEKQKDKKYDEAIPLFLEVFKSNKDALVGKYALIKIEECFTQAGKKDFLEYSKKELKPIIKTADETFVVLLELETHQLVNAGLYKEALDNLFLIKKKYNLNNEIDKNTLYRIGVFYSSLYGDKQNAQKYFDELKTKYPGDDLVNDIDRWMNTPNGASNNSNYIAVAQPAAETPAVENSGVTVENYPNPFNPTTNISFTIPQKSQIKLKVFDVLGREIANLADGVYEAGKYEVTFNASKLPSGVYFYNLTAGNNSISKKMLLVK